MMSKVQILNSINITFMLACDLHRIILVLFTVLFWVKKKNVLSCHFDTESNRMETNQQILISTDKHRCVLETWKMCFLETIFNFLETLT